MTATGTLTLTDFLLARIAEDEVPALAAQERLEGLPWLVCPACGADDGVIGSLVGSKVYTICHPDADTCVLTDAQAATVSMTPADLAFRGIVDSRLATRRALAECEAKRRIVEIHELYPAREPGVWFCGICQDDSEFPGDLYVKEGVACPTLCALALPYADHPDYRDEWRP